MANLSIRGLDEELADKLKANAAKSGVSVNAHVLALIREGLGVVGTERGRRAYHDLDALAGTWSEAERQEFDRATREFEQVDEALWR